MPRESKVAIFAISVCLVLAVFLVALDTTILATAIPKITDEFRSLKDVGWYAGVYALTSAVFQLLFGKIYAIFQTKKVFIVVMIIFEVGSVLCAAAQTSAMLIVGRALAGTGSAGIFAGAFLVISQTVPLRWRPTYNGIFGALYGIASVVGPVLGGLLTDKLSWRWCFWINLPAGVLTIVVVAICLKPNQTRQTEQASDSRPKAAEILQKMNTPSTVTLVCSTIALLLALRWGGADYSWHNGRIIALFMVAAISTIAFVLLQAKQGEEAFVPIFLLKQRTVWACCWFSFTTGSSVVIIIYYLPIWFQAVLQVSATESGLLTLPFTASLVAGSLFSGAVTSKTRHYTPLLMLSTVLRAVGAGLLSSMHVSSARWQHILYQIIFGFGDGCGMQQPLIAVQNTLSQKDIPMGISVIIFCQTLGSAIFIVVGQSIFTDRLKDYLSTVAGIDIQTLTDSGATSFQGLNLAQNVLRQVVSAYSKAITDTFYISVALSCASLVGAVSVEWKKLKDDDLSQEAASRSMDIDQTTSTGIEQSEMLDLSASRRPDTSTGPSLRHGD